MGSFMWLWLWSCVSPIFANSELVFCGSAMSFDVVAPPDTKRVHDEGRAS